MRQETPFTQRAVYLAYQTDCQLCSYREQCLGPEAERHRARRVSAVPRLLLTPSVATRTPIVVGSMRWIDVAGRALRRTWTTHWRRQYVEVLPLEVGEGRVAPPPRAPRSVRSHHRWSWQDRLAQNAWWGPTTPASYGRWCSRCAGKLPAVEGIGNRAILEWGSSPSA